jgi:hypothetical protein
VCEGHLCYPVVGQGKPNNQNHAIIFSRGEALQAIDMNQDGYLEEALKMPSLLEEFGFDQPVQASPEGVDHPRIGRIVGECSRKDEAASRVQRSSFMMPDGDTEEQTLHCACRPHAHEARWAGFREHVFTHDVSSPASFMSLQESNFVTVRDLGPSPAPHGCREPLCNTRPPCPYVGQWTPKGLFNYDLKDQGGVLTRD